MRDLPPPRQRAPHLFVDAPLAAGAALALAPPLAHYVTRVVRRKPGDALLLFNGRAGEWRAETAALAALACWQAALGDWSLV